MSTYTQIYDLFFYKIEQPIWLMSLAKTAHSCCGHTFNNMHSFLAWANRKLNYKMEGLPRVMTSVSCLMKES